MNSSPDKTYRRFLLGLASEEELCSVEEAVLAGELDALTLQVAEDELIDDYLLGSITEEERRGFEEQFLIAEERREKLRFASALIEYTQKAPAKSYSVKLKVASRGGMRLMLSWKHAAFLAATASLLLAVLAGFQLMKLRDQAQVAQEARNEMTRLEAALAAEDQRTAQVVKPSIGIPSITEVAADRMPAIELGHATRGGYLVIFRVPAGVQFARIDLDLSTNFAEQYREVLLSSGQQLWARSFPPRPFRLRNRAESSYRHPFWCREQSIISGSMGVQRADRSKS